MANEWIPSTGAIVAAVLTPFLTAFVPRLWQDDMRRLRSVSETRVKNLEALEKVLSLATKAKEELGIEVPTHELQNELKKIVHEFAGPVVLSREALEEWESRPSKELLCDHATNALKSSGYCRPCASYATTLRMP